MGILLLVSLGYLVFWTILLVDVIRSDFKESNMKLIWVIVLIFAHIIGPTLYLFLGKNSKITL